MKKTLCAALCLFSVSVLAHTSPNIVGTYKCTGHDPYTPRDFSSTMNIQKTGDVYTITETTADNRSDTAIGLASCKALALAYQNKTLSTMGVQLLKIKHHGKKLVGPWAQLGKTTTGTEVCEKQ